MGGETVTWSTEIRQAWSAVPVHAVVQFIRDGELHLWWRHGSQGKVLATWDGGRWMWAFRRDDGLLSGGGWTWDRERDDIRDFVVIARGITPDLSNEEVERRCTVQDDGQDGRWVAWNDVPVDSLVYVDGGRVALRRSDDRSRWIATDCKWDFGLCRKWEMLAGSGGRCRVLATDLHADQMMASLKDIAHNELSRDELASVGLT